MKYPTRLSDAVHILAFIALYPDCDLTSNKLAESVQTNPAYVRQLMSALRKGGLLVSVKGHPRPSLAREPEKITLLDAYRAVEGNKPLLHQDIHTNPACGVGVNIQLVLREFYLDIQKTAEHKMQEITLKDVLEQYHIAHGSESAQITHAHSIMGTANDKSYDATQDNLEGDTHQDIH